MHGFRTECNPTALWVLFCFFNNASQPEVKMVENSPDIKQYCTVVFPHDFFTKAFTLMHCIKPALTNLRSSRPAPPLESQTFWTSNMIIHNIYHIRPLGWAVESCSLWLWRSEAEHQILTASARRSLWCGLPGPRNRIKLSWIEWLTGREFGVSGKYIWQVMIPTINVYVV